jgi:TM2 domain-containing membrane protein YozV
MASNTHEPFQPQQSGQLAVPQSQHYGAPMSAVDQRVAMAEMAAISQQKSVGLAYVLWFFLGALGIHKFYLGRVGIGIAYLLTLGFLTIGLWIDLFTLPKQVRDANMLRRAQVRTQMGV